MYAAQAACRQLKQNAVSLEDYYRDLEMAVSIEEVNELTFSRVHDLLHKTNQFNLTTRRHSASQLRAMIDNLSYQVLTLRVADRFGDYGIVGVAITRRDNDTSIIDSFLLSCRVLGRTIETALLARLLQCARQRGLTALQGEFIATAKNQPAKEFFAEHGFDKIDGDENTGRWRLEVEDARLDWPDYIRTNDDKMEIAA